MRHQLHRRVTLHFAARFLVGAAAALAAPWIVPASAMGRAANFLPASGSRSACSAWATGAAFAVRMRRCRIIKSWPSPTAGGIASPAGPRTGEGVLCAAAGSKSFSTAASIYNDFRERARPRRHRRRLGLRSRPLARLVYSRVIEAGKDIYGEKPITRWIAQGVKVRRSGSPLRLRVPDGMQQRSDPKFRQACELASNGYLGKITRSRRWASPAGRSYPAEPPCDPPQGFD